MSFSFMKFLNPKYRKLRVGSKWQANSDAQVVDINYVGDRHVSYSFQVGNGRRSYLTNIDDFLANYKPVDKSKAP